MNRAIYEKAPPDYSVRLTDCGNFVVMTRPRKGFTTKLVFESFVIATPRRTTHTIGAAMGLVAIEHPHVAPPFCAVLRVKRDGYTVREIPEALRSAEYPNDALFGTYVEDGYVDDVPVLGVEAQVGEHAPVFAGAWVPIEAVAVPELVDATPDAMIDAIDTYARALVPRLGEIGAQVERIIEAERERVTSEEAIARLRTLEKMEGR